MKYRAAVMLLLHLLLPGPQAAACLAPQPPLRNRLCGPTKCLLLPTLRFLLPTLRCLLQQASCRRRPWWPRHLAVAVRRRRHAPDQRQRRQQCGRCLRSREASRGRRHHLVLGSSRRGLLQGRRTGSWR